MLFRTAGVLLAVGATAMPTTRDTNAMNMQFEAKEEASRRARPRRPPPRCADDSHLRAPATPHMLPIA